MLSEIFKLDSSWKRHRSPNTVMSQRLKIVCTFLAVSTAENGANKPSENVAARYRPPLSPQRRKISARMQSKIFGSDSCLKRKGWRTLRFPQLGRRIARSGDDCNVVRMGTLRPVN